MKGKAYHTKLLKGAVNPDPAAEALGRFNIILHSASSRLVEYIIIFLNFNILGMKATAISACCLKEEGFG